MIYVVCGYSGAGKTTYALEHKKESDVIVDLDYLKECLLKYDNINILKDLQLKIAQFFISKNVDIWYITCFPNFDELEVFKNRAKFIWINTNLSRSIKNIYKRNRNGDMSDIENIKKYNQKVAQLYFQSDINFELIDVFDSDERW